MSITHVPTEHSAAYVVASVWWLCRVLFFFLRRRGIARIFFIGAPSPGRNQTAKGEFPVPLAKLQEVSSAFLTIKGFTEAQLNDNVRRFRCNIPWILSRCHIPRWFGWKTVLLNLGERHFSVSKHLGNASTEKLLTSKSKSMSLLSRSDSMTGLTEDIAWVHTRRQARNLSRLFKNMWRHAGKMLFLALMIAIAELEVACVRNHCLSMPHVLPWNTSSPPSTWNNEQRIWCNSFDVKGVSDPSRLPPPGKPCVCFSPRKPGAHCNALLDPAVWAKTSEHRQWCSAFESRAVDNTPCDCVSWSDSHLPNLYLVLVVWIALSSVLWTWCAVAPLHTVASTRGMARAKHLHCQPWGMEWRAWASSIACAAEPFCCTSVTSVCALVMRRDIVEFLFLVRYYCGTCHGTVLSLAWDTHSPSACKLPFLCDFRFVTSSPCAHDRVRILQNLDCPVFLMHMKLTTLRSFVLKKNTSCATRTTRPTICRWLL